ncbi:MAG TPA: hypothetical protein VFQ20_02805 [Burkholderiaceae bacterium]|nr:hypothetical protein [Burkholderiaceae bacterium]
MAGPDLEPDRGDAEPGVASPAGLDLGALVGELGQEIAGPLTAALERVTALATSGRIDRASLARLRLEIESARRAGMVAQQLARLAHRHVRGAPETHRLTQLVRDALAQRSRELVVRDIDLRQSLQPARVRADGACLFAMLHALLDWSIVQAHSRLDVRIELQTWPLQAQLSVRLDRLPPGAADAPEAKTMAWRLVEVTAQAMGLELRHQERPGESFVTVAFPQTVNDQMDGVIAIELDHGFANSLNSKPLAGSHVLVIASKRELRTAIRDAIRHMGLMVDFTSSVEEAREFCDGGVPHAIVYESALGGERFGALRQALRAAVPATAFVAIGEDGRGYETTVVDGHPVTRVGRQALASALPAALVFELSRGIEA